MFRFICAVLLIAASQSPPSASDAVNELLDADRDFSKRAAQTDVVTALAAMFADDVVLPVPGGAFAEGKSKALEAFRANADNLTSRAEWTPIRGGISADGQHGFTFGYMTVKKQDGTVVPMKYLAYWIRRPDGWKVAAYRRRQRPDGPVSPSPMPPSVPAAMVSPTSDTAAIEKHSASLAAAERSFSDRAQEAGLGAAFTEFGRTDAINMGGPKERGFVVGSENIGRAVGEGTPTDRSPVSWAADHKVLVASSGDLGITFGYIRSNEPQKQGPIPFFTIWRRANPSQPWRYIAE